MSPIFKFSGKFVAVVSLALVAMSCNPRHHDSQQQNANAGTGTSATAGTGAGAGASAGESTADFRTACADDMQKYCANDPHKRHCLRENADKLGDACKTAVDAPRGGAGGRGAGIGRVCGDDLQKFCANDPKRFRCLKNNLNQLSDACKTAVTTREQQRGQKPANGEP